MARQVPYFVDLPDGGRVDFTAPVNANEEQLVILAQRAIKAKMPKAVYRRPQLDRQARAQARTFNGEITSTPQTIGTRIEGGVRHALSSVMEEREAARLANKTFSAFNDLTPLGNVTGAEEGGRMAYDGITRGDVGTAALGAGIFAMSVVPGSARRVGENLIEALIRDESGAIRAWHGSPHDFDKFSLSKIGTGEGAQAYGHGLYFAEEKAVAEQYRNDLTRRMAGFHGPDQSAPTRAIALDMNRGVAFEKARREYVRTLKADLRSGRAMAPDAELEWAIDRANALNASDFKPSGISAGRLYEVNINAEPEDFLDWDAPFDRRDHAQILQGMIPDDFAARNDALSAAKSHAPLLESKIAELEALPMQDRLKIGDQYNELLIQQHRVRQALKHDPNQAIRGMGGLHGLGFKGEWESKLRERGVPGIRYLDQGSRGAGGGTRNYVVFDDSLIDIVGKY